MNFQATVRVTKPLNIRSMEPSTSQRIARKEEVGAILRVVEMLPGELWKGESFWYREEGTDNYFWSGAAIVIRHNQQFLPAGPRDVEPRIVRRAGQEITGETILAIARQHIGETYVLGARAPIGNANWKGPWDCAEFVSWCLYQASGILFGTEPRNDPVRADAFTGYWAQQSRAAGCTASVPDGVATAGAILLRYPQPGATGHIVFSDGVGGTVEAHGSKDGVIEGTVHGRRWDTAVLVPGIRYYRNGDEIVPEPVIGVIRLTNPLTKSVTVQAIQRRLTELGYAPGADDGVYGPQTAHAVARFQADSNLVADGEAGSKTLKALGL